MSSAGVILKNALANGAGIICEAVIAFCMLPFILNRIGESAYGVWAFTIAISGYMGILNFGFRPAINKYVSQYSATGEWGKIRNLLQASLFSYSFCAAVILLICIILSININVLFNIPAEFEKIAAVLIFMVGVQMSCGLLAVVFGGVISGLQRYEINNGIEICVMLVRTAIIVAFLDSHTSLVTLAAAHFSTTIVGYFATVFMAYRISEIAPIHFFRKPNRDSIIVIFKFSIITFVIAAVGRIIMFLDSPLIASVLTTSAVTYYTIGSRLLKYLRSFIEVIMNVMMPAVSDLQARGKLTAITDIYMWSSKISSLITFPVAAFLVAFGNEFFILWLGKSYPQSYNVMLVLIAASIIYHPQINTVSILFGTARHKILMYLSIISGAISIFLAFFLGRHFGLTGIAIGLSWPQAILFGFTCPVYVAKLLKLSYWNWLIETYVHAILAVLPFCLLLYAVKHFFLIDTWLKFIELVVVSGLLYLCTAWQLGLNRHDKVQVSDMAGEIKKKFSSFTQG